VQCSSPYYTPEHEAFRDTVRRFVLKEIEPFATEWDEAGEFPRELYRKAAGIGRDSQRSTAWRLDRSDHAVPDLCMLKNQATQTLAFCASEAVQFFGGAGFMRGCKVERIYREVKVNAIGGGAEEIMKDLAARQLGW